MDQETQIQQFFNDMAEDYAEKYSAKDRFHQYFFNQRLQLATEGLDLKEKRILDIGTGTGNLYDYLKAIEPSIEFYGNDIAERILEYSHIPEERRYADRCYEADFGEAGFDYIFLLGVTTYNEPRELQRIFRFAESVLAPGGLMIISFTGKWTLDAILRNLLRWPARLFPFKSRVLSQSFRIYKYSLRDVKSLFNDSFAIQRVAYHNQTFFPFNRLWRKASIRLAKTINAGVKGRLRHFLSSDYIIFARHEDS